MIEIYYVLNSRWPTIKAYGLQVAKTCEGFKRNGAKVRLVIPIRARHRELRGMNPFDIYGIHDRFRLIRLPSLDFSRIHLNYRIFFLFQQVLFAVMAAVVLLFKRGTVYSRDPFTLYLLSFVSGDIFWEVHRIPDNLRTGTYQRLLRRCAGVICVTEGIRSRFLREGVDGGRLLVAPDGIDVAEFDIVPTTREAKQKLGLNSDKHYIVYVGQLFEWKGVGTLIHAAQLLDDRFSVIIIGGTYDEVAVLRKTDRNGSVRFVPFQPHNRIPLWLRAADTVVLPNRRDGGISEFYTSPLKMFEYMASGKSIVASDLPSIREVLNERNAILVAPDDARALSEGILRSAEEGDASRARALQAQSDARQYTWSKRCATIIHFINHAISH